MSFDTKNVGVVTGVVLFDPDSFTTKDDLVIGRVKIEHKHEKADRKSQFVLKGFGKLGEQIVELSAGQTVKAKYELAREAWKNKDDEWQELVCCHVTELEASEAPQAPEEDDDDDDDIPF